MPTVGFELRQGSDSEPKPRTTFASVSYTHLDVYKRQYQSTALFSGRLGGGVGSAGGVRPGGAGGVLGGGIDRVGSAPCCDPNLFVSYGWSNAVTPLNYTVVSGVPIDITHQDSVSVGYSQGFLTGTSLFVSESSSRLNLSLIHI